VARARYALSPCLPYRESWHIYITTELHVSLPLPSQLYVPRVTMIRSPSTVTIITANSSFASQSSRNSAAAAYLIAPRPTTSYNQEKVRLNFEANASNSQQDDRKRGLTIEGKLQLVFRVLLLLVHLGPLRVILIEQAAYGWPTYFSVSEQSCLKTLYFNLHIS
jgi:hypothetical protein